MATLEVETTLKVATNRHCHTEKFSGDTYLKEYLPEEINMKPPATQQGGGGEGEGEGGGGRGSGNP